MTCENAKPFVMAAYGLLVTLSSAIAVINPLGFCFYLGLVGLVLGPVLLVRAVPKHLMDNFFPTMRQPIRVAAPAKVSARR